VSVPLISVVIPTRDGARTLPALLDAIAAQRIDLPIETIAIDSGSTDGSVEMLRTRVDRLVEIAPRAFDHGLTRNAAIEQARGDLIVLIVQDAIPASNAWLGHLTRPLLDDDRVAGVFARQRPRDDASVLTRHYAARWVAAGGEPRHVSVPDGRQFTALAPMDRFLTCAFDNVCACVRRSVWQRHPFRPTPIAEDLEWARDVLLAGHTLVYEPRAVVIHSHDRDAAYEFDRTRRLHSRLYDLFGVRTIPTVPALVRSIGASVALHARCARSASPRHEGDRWGRMLALAVAWPLGQYLGGRAGVRGAARGDRAGAAS